MNVSVERYEQVAVTDASLVVLVDDEWVMVEEWTETPEGRRVKVLAATLSIDDFAGLLKKHHGRVREAASTTIRDVPIAGPRSSSFVLRAR